MTKKSRLAERRKPKKEVKSKKPVWIFVVLLILTAFIYLNPKTWDKNSRLGLTIQNESGSVTVVSFDPVLEKITTIEVPATTQMSVSRQLGEWQMGSVWKLGENESIGGRLIAETVTKTLKFPVDAWASSKATGFLGGSPLKLFTAFLSPYKTNLTLRDRFNLMLFVLKVKNTGRVSIDLEDTGYIYRDKLADGELGYRVRSTIPSKLAATFADSSLSQEGLVLRITDAGENAFIAKEVGEIVEVLGAKVISIDSEDSQNVNCVVTGPKSLTTTKIASIFECDTKFIKEGKTVELLLGKEFYKRF